MTDDLVSSALTRATRRLLPLLFICYIVAYLDRVNIGFAKLQMAASLELSDAVYGFGAGIFFIGYFLFEVPSNLLLARLGARVWIARIMVSWGIISGLFAVVDRIPWGPLPALFGVAPTVFSFYALRFLLGLAEAGFFPGIILYLTYWFPTAQRARTVALFMTAIAVANVIGAPVSAAIMQFADGASGWQGWRWLFVLEALPSVVLGVLLLRLLPDGPRDARWLSREQGDALARFIEVDAASGSAGVDRSLRAGLLSPRVWALAFVYLSGTFALYGVNFWMPTLVQELGVDRSDYLRVGLLTMIPWGIAGFAMVRYGAHSDRTGERRWHVAGALLFTGLGLALMAFAGTRPVPAMLAMCLTTTGILCYLGTFWSVPTAFLRGTAAAAGIAWINSVGNLGGHFGPDFIGRVRDATGDTGSALLAVAGVTVLGSLLLIISARQPPTA